MMNRFEIMIRPHLAGILGCGELWVNLGSEKTYVYLTADKREPDLEIAGYDDIRHDVYEFGEWHGVRIHYDT